jgi:hypothetical protein
MGGERKRERGRVQELIVKQGVYGNLLPHGAGPDVLGPCSPHDSLCAFQHKGPRQ